MAMERGRTAAARAMARCLALPLLAAVSDPTVAATSIWDGGGADNNWSTADNWDDNVAPTPGVMSNVIFTGNQRREPVHNLAAGSNWGDITFDEAAADTFTLSGNAITLRGRIDNSSGFDQFVNLDVALTSHSSFHSLAGVLSMGGVISGNFDFTKLGTGEVHLAADNTFTGEINIEDGWLSIPSIASTGTAQPLGMGSSRIHFGSATTFGGTLAYTGAGAAELDRQLTIEEDNFGSVEVADANAILTINGTITGNDSYFWTAGAGETVVRDVISGLVELAHFGSGTLTLEAVNTYTGVTDVSDGTLKVTGSIASSSLTTAWSVGTVSGDGTTGDLEVREGGTVAPGDGGAGILNVVGDAYFGIDGESDGGNYAWELTDANGQPGSGGYDQLSVSDALFIADDAAPFTIKIFGGSVANWNPNNTYSWKIVDSVIGMITGFSPEKFVIDTTNFAPMIAPGYFFSVSASGGDLYLTYATPEPTTTLLFGLAAAALILPHRRRRGRSCQR